MGDESGKAPDPVGRRRALKATAGVVAGAVVWSEPTLKGLARRPAYAVAGSGGFCTFGPFDLVRGPGGQLPGLLGGTTASDGTPVQFTLDFGGGAYVVGAFGPLAGRCDFVSAMSATMTFSGGGTSMGTLAANGTYRFTPNGNFPTGIDMRGIEGRCFP